MNGLEPPECDRDLQDTIMKNKKQMQEEAKMLKEIADVSWRDETPPKVRSGTNYRQQVSTIFTEETTKLYDGSDEAAEKIKGKTKMKNAHRHFVQPYRDWGGPEEVGTILDRLNIPEESTALVIGGYTGEFADALSECGIEIIFTDPLKEWCEKASEKGYTTYQGTAQTIPKRLLNKADFAATFEAFQPFQHESSTFNMLRMLTLPYGCLLFESEFTRNDMDSPTTFLSDYNWIEDNHNGEVTYRENNGLRAYSFTSNSPKVTYTPSQSALGYLLPMAIGNQMAENPDEGAGPPQVTLDQSLLDTADSKYGIPPYQLYTAARRYWFDYFKHKIADTMMERYEPRNRAEGPAGTLRFGEEAADERHAPKNWMETEFNQAN